MQTESQIFAKHYICETQIPLNGEKDILVQE